MDAIDSPPVWLERALADLRCLINRTPALAGVPDFRTGDALATLGRWLERFDQRDRSALMLSAALGPVDRAERIAGEADRLREMLPPEDRHLAGALAHAGTPAAEGSATYDAAGVPTEWATLAEVERWQVERCLSACKGNQSDTAKCLGVARATIHNLVNLYRLRRNPIGARPRGLRPVSDRPRLLPDGIPSPAATLAEVERWHVGRVFARVRDRGAIARRLGCSRNHVTTLARRYDLWTDRPATGVPFTGSLLPEHAE